MREPAPGIADRVSQRTIFERPYPVRDGSGLGSPASRRGRSDVGIVPSVSDPPIAEEIPLSGSWRTIHNPLIGDAMTFLRTSEETGGELTELEIELAPGGGNPLHYHRTYSERFEVLAGTLGVQVGPATRTLSAGESAVISEGTNHRFFNPTAEHVRFRVELRPGHTGFEQSMRILYGLARDGRTDAAGMPRSLSHVAVAGAISDMGVAGALGLLQPLFRFLARRARRNGTERALLERYCTPPEDAQASTPGRPPQ